MKLITKMSNKLVLIITLASTLVFAWTAAYADSNGKMLYEKDCAGCHGAAGQGGGKMAQAMGVTAPKSLSDTVKSRVSIEAAMFQGVKGIQGHGTASTYLDQDRTALIDYAFSLAGKAK